jgi:hypothetical protein
MLDVAVGGSNCPKTNSLERYKRSIGHNGFNLDRVAPASRHSERSNEYDSEERVIKVGLFVE